MDGSNLVFIVVPIVIPLILAIGIALPFVAARDTTPASSSALQPDRTPQHRASLVSAARAPIPSAGVGARTAVGVERFVERSAG